MKRFILSFAVLALAAASAETYRVTLHQPSVVKGKELKAGEYKINVTDQKVVIVNGKNNIEVPAKVENGEQKFSSTTVRYAAEGGKYAISEIRLGGTRTRLVFNQ